MQLLQKHTVLQAETTTTILPILRLVSLLCEGVLTNRDLTQMPQANDGHFFHSFTAIASDIKNPQIDELRQIQGLQRGIELCIHHHDLLNLGTVQATPAICTAWETIQEITSQPSNVYVSFHVIPTTLHLHIRHMHEETCRYATVR